MTLKNIFDRICSLDQKVQVLAAGSHFDPLMGFMAPLCPDPDTSGPDTLFMKHSLENIMEHLYDVHEEVSYLKKPFYRDFVLERFTDGKVGYYDDQGCRHELSWGSRLSAKVPDIAGRSRWIRTPVCYNGRDYFLWKDGTVPIPGLTIRERW